MKKILVVLLTISLWGCVTLPKKYNFNNQKTIQMSSDKIIAKIFEWCLFNKIAIPTRDVVSDLTVLSTDGSVADWQGITFSSWDGLHYKKIASDCGKLGIEDKGGIAKKAKLNFSLKKITDDVTAVSCTITFYDSYNNDKLGCNSTGLMEKEIFEFIEGKVVSN